MGEFIVNNETEIRAIYAENLLAVRVEEYICTFFVENEPPFSCTKSLKETVASLPDFFIQINRNCIVNADKIKSINFKNKEVRLTTGITFPFSVRNTKVLKKHFRDNMLKLLSVEK
jgi:DNA-binding LytR/AlgR family response regulator